MNKVITMNLNGNAHQLEEPGYASLSAYLAQAKDSLNGNLDQAEIMADLEQAIADKFRRFLTPHKSVITVSEVETVIEEMGPVTGDSTTQTDETKQAAGPKRLYRVVDGEWIAGIANGVAAYFNVDVVPIRILFVFLFFITSGGFALAYLLAWLFIPVAETKEQQAEARGIPFNAEELIARAKTEYAKIGDKGSEWRHQWRNWRREMKRQQRETRKWQHVAAKYQYQYHRPSFFGQLISVLVITFFVWLGYHHVPVIHQFLDAMGGFVQHVSDRIVEFIVSQNTH